MYYVYVLVHPQGKSYYYGFSSDLKRRIKEHEQRDHINWKLVYYESYLDKSEALERERKLKQYGAARGHLKRRIAKSVEIALKSAGWLRAFCLMSLRVSVSGKLKSLWDAGVGKPSPNRAIELLALDPKRRWSTHDQVEARVRSSEGPNRCMLKNARMSCG